MPKESVMTALVAILTCALIQDVKRGTEVPLSCLHWLRLLRV